MNCLLHGNNTVASRAELVRLVEKAKEEGQEVIRLDGGQAQETDLVQALESGSFLGKGRMVVLENFLNQARKTTSFIDQIKRSQTAYPLVFWEGKSVSPATIKRLGQWRLSEREFKIPPLLFRFLDLVAPGRNEANLRLFRQVIVTESAELIFYLLARQVRLLLLAKSGSLGAEVPSWKADRLKRQASLFAEEELIGLYRKLLEIDASQKTGQAALPLSSQLDLLLASL